MASTPSILKAALFITLLGFILQLAGFVLPWWFVIGDGLYMSMWYMLLCRSGIAVTSNCTIIVFNAVSTVTEYDGTAIAGLVIFTVMQVLVTISLGLSFFSVVGLIGSNCSKSKSKSCYGLICFFLFLSAFLLLPVIGFVSWVYVATATALTDFSLQARSFPWSVLSSGLGLLFTFIAFVTLAVAMCKWRRIFDDDDVYDDNYQGGHGYVGMSNMDNTGYEHPKQGYDRAGYPQQKSYPADRHYQQPYSSNYGSSHKYGSSSAPYNSDNMYRGYQKKY